MAKALVTGASKGIGRDIALTLARAGHTVVATMRNPGDSDLMQIASSESILITTEELDVDDDASVAELFASPNASPSSLDILVNNAGTLSVNTIEDETVSSMQRVMNTNYFGVVRCMKAVVPAMRARGGGLIINISSICGRMSAFALGSYSASKQAMEAMSEACAQELAPFGVRVALVEPGIIATSMVGANLPKPKPDSVYPHGQRLLDFYAGSPIFGPSPTVVTDVVLDIVSGKTTLFRNLCGPDAAPFLQLRSNFTDEAWIAVSDTLEDQTFFERVTAASKAVRPSNQVE